jgi:RHH-type transcriptional regulator, rel operon repressor / antitoxin RelB
MTTLNIDLPKELEKQLTYLEVISKRPKSFFVQEALKKYLEDLEDLWIGLESLEAVEKREKTYTTDEILADLKNV